MAIRGPVTRPRRRAARLYLLLGQIISRPICVKAKMGSGKEAGVRQELDRGRSAVPGAELSAGVMRARPDMKKLANLKICQLKQ